MKIDFKSHLQEMTTESMLFHGNFKRTKKQQIMSGQTIQKSSNNMPETEKGCLLILKHVKQI